MNEKQAKGLKAEEVQFSLPFEKPPTAPKNPKKEATSQKEKAKEIILKTKEGEKQVRVLYNPKIDSLKIKYENYKVVYSYLELPQQLKENYQNTYQIFNSLRYKNKKILIDEELKCLVFSDQKRPKPIKSSSQSQQIHDDEAFARSLSSGVIWQLEQSLQILCLIRGPKRSLLAEQYVIIGKEYLRQNFYNRAKQYFEWAFKVYEELGHGRTEQCAKIHVELGRLYTQQGEKEDRDGYEKKTFLTDNEKCAISEYKAALDILSFIKISNLSETKANILNALGLIYFGYEPDKDQAKEYFQEALSHTQLLDKSAKPCFDAYLNLAKLHNSKKNLKDAEEAYRIVSEYQKMINQKVFDTKKKNQLLCQLQYACLGTRRYQEGLAIISKMENPDSWTINRILTRWGNILSRLQNSPNGQLVSTPQLVQLLQTFMVILTQYVTYKQPSDDDRVFAITNKLQRLKGN